MDFKGKWNGLRAHALFVPPFGGSYRTIHFTDSAIAAGMPIRNLNHIWNLADPNSPHSPKTSLLGCGTNSWLSCFVDVRESGFMTSTTRVNGVVHTDSVTIYCTETEPLLNHHTIRQGLLAVLDSSNASNPDAALRSERMYFVLQDTVTAGAPPYIQILPRGPNDNVCEFHLAQHLSVPTPWPNRKVIGWGHSHPSEPGQSVECTNSDGTIVGSGWTLDHASPEDWIVADNYNNAQRNPGFASNGWLPGSGSIIDLHRFMMLRPGQGGGDETAAGNAFVWDRGRCAWPKGSI